MTILPSPAVTHARRSTSVLLTLIPARCSIAGMENKRFEARAAAAFLLVIPWALVFWSWYGHDAPNVGVTAFALLTTASWAFSSSIPKKAMFS